MKGGREQLHSKERHYWVAAERARTFSMLFGEAQFNPRWRMLKPRSVSRRCFVNSGYRMDVASGAGHSDAARREFRNSGGLKFWALFFAWKRAGLCCGEISVALPERPAAPEPVKAQPSPHKNTRSNGASGACWRAFIALRLRHYANRLSL